MRGAGRVSRRRLLYVFQIPGLIVMPILVAAVLTMSAAQLLDLVTFMNMVNAVGPLAEANPLVATLFGAVLVFVAAGLAVAAITLPRATS